METMRTSTIESHDIDVTTTPRPLHYEVERLRQCVEQLDAELGQLTEQLHPLLSDRIMPEFARLVDSARPEVDERSPYARHIDDTCTTIDSLTTRVRALQHRLDV